MITTFRCGCTEENFDYQTCPIHAKPILKRFRFNPVLAARVRFQKKIVSQENILLVNQLENQQRERELQQERLN